MLINIQSNIYKSNAIKVYIYICCNININCKLHDALTLLGFKLLTRGKWSWQSYTKRLQCVRLYMVAIQFKCTYNHYRKLTVWHSASSFWRWDLANRKSMEYVRLLLTNTLLLTKKISVGKCIMHFQVLVLCQWGQSWINVLSGSKIAFDFWPNMRSVVQCGWGFCKVRIVT